MITSLPFLILTLALLPSAAWFGYRRSRLGTSAMEDLPSLRAMAAQNLVTQSIVAGLAAFAVSDAAIGVRWRSDLSVIALLTAVGVLLVALTIARIEARRPLGPTEVVRRMLRTVAPTDPVWVGVAVVAAIVEEFAYRGVLVALLATWVSLPIAIGFSAVAFGVAHLSAGPRAVVISAGFGLAMQALVVLSGGLLLAIVTHLAYDLAVARLGRRLDAGAA